MKRGFALHWGMSKIHALPGAALLLLAATFVLAYPEPIPQSRGQRLLDAWFERKVAGVERQGSLATLTSAAQWSQEKPEARRQLARMLGLDPLPPRTDLKPVLAGTVESGDVVVERLHFQSSPGLYVTANLYRPKVAPASPLPAVLYLCGHGPMKDKGVSYGNKTAYQHHGLWFARHGYVCLAIDTIQLGEIEGEHHGTHRLGKWWWISRGYTPAGVEAWNAIRSVDYLETRPEVDPKRIGVTGRSGGGAYAWWVAALDDRIAVAAPTAGITDLRNHVVDGCIEGHCDCMYPLNTHRWDFDRVAALVAPRPLLIVNTDKDTIFPLDGVVRLYQSTRRLYALMGVEDRIGLHIAEGPHKDTQPLHTGAFHWFNRHLKGADLMDMTAIPAVKEIEPSELRVFGKELPSDQINTRIDHLFVPAAPAPSLPADAAGWEKQRHAWMTALTSGVFAAWPDGAVVPAVTESGSAEKDGLRMTAYDFESEEPYQLRLLVLQRAGLRPEDIKEAHLHILDDDGWKQFGARYQSRFAGLLEESPSPAPDETAFAQGTAELQILPGILIYFCPRGIGPTAWQGSAKALTHRLRRFPLVGETLASTQVWDIRRALQALRQIHGLPPSATRLTGHRGQAANALIASLFEPAGAAVVAHELPSGLQAQNCNVQYPGMLRSLDLPQVVAIAASRTQVALHTADPAPWQYPLEVTRLLDLQGHLRILPVSESR